MILFGDAFLPSRIYLFYIEPFFSIIYMLFFPQNASKPFIFNAHS